MVCERSEAGKASNGGGTRIMDRGSPMWAAWLDRLGGARLLVEAGVALAVGDWRRFTGGTSSPSMLLAPKDVGLAALH